MAFNFLLQVELLGMGNTLLSRVIPLYFSIIFRGTSSKQILDSVLVFFLRVIIHRLPSKNVCRLSSANPVKVENMNRSLTSSCVLSGISVFIIVCISSLVIYPLSTLSDELIYPAKGLNGKRPSFLAIEIICFSTIM